MLLAADSKDDVVAGEIDFDHHVPGGHFFQQLVRLIFVHHVHAVADAFGVRLFDGEANVAAEAFVRDETGRNLAGVKADVNLGIQAVQKRNNAHVQRVIFHRDGAVFRHHNVDADDAGIG